MTTVHQGAPPKGAPPGGDGGGGQTPRLAMRGVTKVFGSVTVLRGVDMAVQRGEVHGLVGQNGAGKSTLARILAGNYPDHSGTVEIDGTRVGLSSPRQARDEGVAVIYQDFSLVPQLTVAQNIMLGTEPGALYSPALVRQSAARLLEQVGMGAEFSLDAVVSSLRAGERQRVEIAKALTRQAKVLVLDEPTARLAGPEREKLFELMARLAERGTAMVFVSHFLEEVIAHTSHVTVLRDGAVVAEGPTSGFDMSSLTTALVGRQLAEEQRTAQLQAEEAGERADLGVPELLRASGLSGGRQVTDVSLALHQGEIVGMAGLVGSGRTSVARMLVGADRPRTGQVFLRGQPVTLKDPRHALRLGVALLPEDRKAQGLLARGSVGDNLVLTCLAARRSRLGLVRPRALSRQAREAVRDFEVRPADERRTVGTLSGGNQQKVLLARVILSAPDVLIVDQPTAGVDVGTKVEIHRVLTGLAGTGKAVLVISDDVDELTTLCHRVVVLRRGRVVSEAPLGVTSDKLVELISTGVSSG